MTYEELIQRTRNALLVRDYALAERFVTESLEIKPDSPYLHVLLGTIYTKTGRINKAVSEFQKSIELKPENPEAYNNLGCLVASLCYILLQKAHDLHGRVIYNIANFYKQAGQKEKAKEFYPKAIDLDPEFPLPYSNLGNLYEEAGLQKLAEETYRDGLLQDRNNPNLSYNLGVSLQSQGRDEEAVKNFSLALRVKPGWAEGMNNLGVSLIRLHDYEKALGVLGEALQAEPSAQIRNNIGVAWKALGENEKAAEFFEASLKENPDYARAAINLTEINEIEGDMNSAVNLLESFAVKDPETEVYSRLESFWIRAHSA